jgi:hypothetical protein
MLLSLYMPTSRFATLEFTLDVILLAFVAVCFFALVPVWLGTAGNCTFYNGGDFASVNHCDISSLTPVIGTIQTIGAIIFIVPGIFLVLFIALLGLSTSPNVAFLGILAALAILILCDLLIKVLNANRPLSPALAARWALLVISILCLYPSFIALGSLH